MADSPLIIKSKNSFGHPYIKNQKKIYVIL